MSGRPEATPGRVSVPVPPAKPSSMKRLAEMQARIPEAADLILLGDSLAAAWPDALLPAAFPNRRVWNFGLPGDRIQNTLWRLNTGATAHLRPREVVLLLGTNNLGDGDPPGAIAAGVLAVMRRARDLWGMQHGILVTIPRRGELPGFREADRLAVNMDLARQLATSRDMACLDADRALAFARGDLPSLDPDLLHISRAGYDRLSRAVRTALDIKPASACFPRTAP